MPSTPYWVLLWQLQGHLSIVQQGAATAPERLPSRATVFGPRNVPSTVISDDTYHVFFVVLLPGVMKELAGIEGTHWVNAHKDLNEVLGAASESLSEAMLNSRDDVDRINLIERYLHSHLQADWRKSFNAPARLTHWLHHLSGVLWMTRACLSTRHVERRARQLTGLTLGSLRRMTRVEATLLHTWTKSALEQRVSWSEISQELRYADQSHMCREVRQVTGFTPQVLRQKCCDSEDEAFWFYRSWH